MWLGRALDDPPDYAVEMRRILGILFLALATDCSSSNEASSTRTCTEGGKSYETGKSWPCSDGCNTCGCNEDGALISTKQACGCVEGAGYFAVGQTWTCADGCNTCACVSHGMISTTLVECDAGADSSVDASSPDTMSDAGCSVDEVLIHGKAGCDGSVVPTCEPRVDTGCVTIVCGCDGKVHGYGCEGAQGPFQSKDPSSTEEGAPCGDAGTSPG